jgi:hypothetical protein
VVLFEVSTFTLACFSNTGNCRNLDVHMELLCKLWVWITQYPTAFVQALIHALTLLLYNPFAPLVIWPQEYFVHHNDDLIDNVEICISNILKSRQL